HHHHHHHHLHHMRRQHCLSIAMARRFANLVPVPAASFTRPAPAKKIKKPKKKACFTRPRGPRLTEGIRRCDWLKLSRTFPLHHHRSNNEPPCPVPQKSQHFCTPTDRLPTGL